MVLHGFAQITSQAIRLCADEDVAVHWMTLGGGLVGSLAPSAQSGQRHLSGEFWALSDTKRALGLAKRLVRAKSVGPSSRFVLPRDPRTTADGSRRERPAGAAAPRAHDRAGGERRISHCSGWRAAQRASTSVRSLR